MKFLLGSYWYCEKKIVASATILNLYCSNSMVDIKIYTLGYFVDRTFTNMVKFINQELKATGLDFQHPQFSILMVLANNEGISQSLMTEYVDRDKASVSRNINDLETKGYIKRKLDGGKKKLLYLTEKGKEVIPTLLSLSSMDTERTLKGFSEKKKKDVYELLTKMYLNISSEIRN